MQLARVEALALAEGEQAELVVVVRDQDHACHERLSVDRDALRPGAAQRQPQGVRTGERLAPAPAALAPVHEPGVDAERHVVEEDAVPGAADVDQPFGPARERVKRCDRVVAVEAEVAGEVVARAEGHADEGQLALERDLRDRAERAVAAGDPECLGLGAACELGRILAGAEHAHLDAASPCLVRQFLRVRRARAGARVDEQEPRHPPSVVGLLDRTFEPIGPWRFRPSVPIMVAR
jgi:hypothetical protein